jgi:hypothetical protein
MRMAVDGKFFLFFPQLHGARIAAEIRRNFLPSGQPGSRRDSGDKTDFGTHPHAKTFHASQEGDDWRIP